MMMKRVLIAVAGLSLSVAGVTPAPADVAACSAGAAPSGGDWPLYGHDLANTRVQPHSTIDASNAPLLQPVWSFSSKGAGGDGDFTGTPIEADGCVFVGSNLGWVYAIDAETGVLAWKTHLDTGTINSTLAVDDGRVFAAVSLVGAPYVIALDQHTGAELWRRTTDAQEGADAFASPTVYNGVVFEGVSGDAAQHDDEDVRVGFRGGFVLIDAETGELLKKTYTIPEQQWLEGYAGASISATPAIDAAAALAYAGTTSAYVPQLEPALANSLLKIDLRRESPTFGEVLDSMKGDTFDRVVPGYGAMPCEDLPIPPPPAIVPTGRGVGACGDVDVDFASSPNLFTLGGVQYVGASQKSGVYHLARASNMEQAWESVWGPAQPFGGVSTAFDGERIIGGGAPPGYLWSIDPADGALGWASPVLDGAHYGIPVAESDGVAYTVDVKGFLDACDAATGAPLLHHPIANVGTGTDPILSFAGVSVARNTVYAATGIQSTGADAANVSNGYVVAFRPPALS
jgi:polyvinyl alcohol dehydrogenase (cytochrome)